MVDEKDKLIIDELINSGREPASSIAERIDLSVPSVIERIKKLQEADIITGFKATINYKKLGLDVSAFVTIISESSAHYKQFRKKIKDVPEIVKCFSTTGGGSHVLYVQTSNTDSLEKLLSAIQQWPGVIRTETQLILSSYKD
tara:strand:+ start:2720 stop:3148 length:429 start_codon:yes stop_codon:yes gene_type:complete